MRRRRFFDNFLMTTLHRAITIAQINRIPELVCQHLNFNMARLFEVLFHVDHGIGKCRLRLGARHLHRIEQRRLGMHHAHAAPAATARRLNNDGVADRTRSLDDFPGHVGQGAFTAGHTGHAGFFHGGFGTDLVAHQTDRFRFRADENKTAFLHTLGKIGIL